jgi:hypothetical protein
VGPEFAPGEAATSRIDSARLNNWLTPNVSAKGPEFRAKVKGGSEAPAAGSSRLGRAEKIRGRLLTLGFGRTFSLVRLGVTLVVGFGFPFESFDHTVESSPLVTKK